MSTWKEYETEEATAEKLERLKSKLFGENDRQQLQVHKRVRPEEDIQKNL